MNVLKVAFVWLCLSYIIGYSIKRNQYKRRYMVYGYMCARATVKNVHRFTVKNGQTMTIKDHKL